jgi:hypothetical protein
VDPPIEVAVTELKARFNGGYSDVYIGQFGDEIVRLHDTLPGNTRLTPAFRWL